VIRYGCRLIVFPQLALDVFARETDAVDDKIIAQLRRWLRRPGLQAPNYYPPGSTPPRAAAARGSTFLAVQLPSQSVASPAGCQNSLRTVSVDIPLLF
jgi:hypothetical protein